MPVFTNYDFSSTLGSATRTMPDRIDDIRNVKEFGAKGDGNTDDAAAFQAAVDWDTGPDRGIIFVPPGDYKVNSPITYNYGGALSVHFIGCGALSRVTGNFADFIFKRNVTNPTSGTRTFEKMHITNNSSSALSGCIQMMGTVVGVVRDCVLSGIVGIDCRSHIDSIAIESCSFLTQASWPTGSRCVVTAGHTRIVGCDASGFEEAIRACGPAVTIIGGRYEVHKTAIVLGKTQDGTTFGTTGAVVMGTTFEANDRTIDVHAVTAGVIQGNSIQGTNGAPAGQSVDGIYVSGCQNSLIAANSISGGFTNSCIRAGGYEGIIYECNNTTNNGTHRIEKLNYTSRFIDNGTESNPDLLPAIAYADRPTTKAPDGMRIIFTNLNSSTIGAAAASGGSNRMMCEYNRPNTTWYIMRPAPAS